MEENKLYNEDLVTQLLSVTSNKELSKAQIVEKMVEKAGEIIGSKIDLTVKTPVKKEKKASTTKSASTPIERFEADKVDMMAAIKQGMEKKPASKGGKKPKQTPLEKFAKALLKLAGKYADDEDMPIAQYIIEQNDKQYWTNTIVAIQLKEKITVPDEAKPKADTKIPPISSLIEKFNKAKQDVLFEMSGKDLKTLVKGAKADQRILMEGVMLSCTQLNAIAGLCENITFYKMPQPNFPVYYVSELFEGLITPIKWDGNVEAELEKGTTVWNKPKAE